MSDREIPNFQRKRAAEGKPTRPNGESVFSEYSRRVHLFLAVTTVCVLLSGGAVVGWFVKENRKLNAAQQFIVEIQRKRVNDAFGLEVLQIDWNVKRNDFDAVGERIGASAIREMEQTQALPSEVKIKEWIHAECKSTVDKEKELFQGDNLLLQLTRYLNFTNDSWFETHFKPHVDGFFALKERLELEVASQEQVDYELVHYVFSHLNLEEAPRKR